MDVTLPWLLTAALMLLHQDQASPYSAASSTPDEGPLVQLAPAAPRREKRCSCENQKDKECIFFCHIGIVWVNTPSRLVPYGFGSVRLRRELLQRCLCSDPRDVPCLSFCSDRTRAHGKASVARRAAERLRRCTAAFWEKRSRLAPKHQT